MMKDLFHMYKVCVIEIFLDLKYLWKELWK